MDWFYLVGLTIEFLSLLIEILGLYLDYRNQNKKK